MRISDWSSDVCSSDLVIDVKEIKLRPNIDDNDYNVKMRNARRFIEEGDKVKVTMRFRGREMAHQDLGMDVLVRVRDELDELAKVEQMPKVEGRQMIMVLARSEEHTSELQSLMRISYAVFCLKKKKNTQTL